MPADASPVLFFPQSTPAKPRNIIICCDGTGNDYTSPNVEPGKKNSGQNSNVVKLYTALRVDNDQVAYYHPGVGTMGAPTANHRWSKLWTKIEGLAFGAGFRDNVLDAYRYIMEQYNDNGGHGKEDRVYIFGFSRGAYTARSLAGLLEGYGLLCRGNEGHLAYAWRMYVAQHTDRTKDHVHPDISFRDTFSHKTFHVHFMGVWDTVSSVGWISQPLRLFNVAKGQIIRTGRHAVSIDEHRCFFMDNLWSAKPQPGQDLQQVWFAGVHSDLGGGYPQNESWLSNISLKWMLLEAKSAGLILDPVRQDLLFGKAAHPPVTPDLLYREPKEFWNRKSFFSLKRFWKHESLHGFWFLPELAPHMYYDEDLGKEYYRVPFGLRRRKLPPGALVHDSVMHALRDTQRLYKPKNLPQTALSPSGVFGADGTEYLRFKVPHDRRASKPMLRFELFLVVVFFIFFWLMFFPSLLLCVGLFLWWLGGWALCAIELLYGLGWWIFLCSLAIFVATGLFMFVVKLGQTKNGQPVHIHAPHHQPPAP